VYGFLLAAACVAAGCQRQPYLTPERLAKGLVVVLPGVEGRGALNEAVCRGLDAGGVDWGIRLEDWTSPWGPLYNLRAELDNRQKASRIALRVAEYRFAHPDSPIVLVGQSGGGTMALWIAEAMPEGRHIDGLILLSPAVSPGYMVDFAISKTRRGAVCFYSQKDWLFLGLGTMLSGTMDGRHTSSAGRVGFLTRASAGRAKGYDRLFQIAWHEQMAASGHTGGHLGGAAEGFVQHYVAPFVRATCRRGRSGSLRPAATGRQGRGSAAESTRWTLRLKLAARPDRCYYREQDILNIATEQQPCCCGLARGCLFNMSRSC
jgi:pimeloyl-ACP methyl ester carboxylesterase